MNCCNDFGECKQGFNCPARTTPMVNQDDHVALWLPTVTFFLGVGTGAGLVMLYLTGAF